MLSRNPVNSGQQDLFRARLEAIIDLRHGLVKLSAMVDWEGLQESLKGFYSADTGRPGGSIRLMCGLLLLKQYSGLSDEGVCAAWAENPYFQYFCGEEFFQHRLPVEPPSLSIFRGRVGETGMERLFQETVRIGLAAGAVKEADLQHVSVDTTVQEKAVKFPTDLQLCNKARQVLVELAHKHGVRLRQTYTRNARKIGWTTRKALAARKPGQARAGIKTMKNYLGRVLRELERAALQRNDLKSVFSEALRKARRIFEQTLAPQNGPKLYAWHAEEVECIAKGKTHKKYEFGCKMSLAVTNRSNFIVGALALHGNPHDSKTLRPALAQVQRVTGVQPSEIQVDLGYRGHGIEAPGLCIIHPRLKSDMTPALKKRRKRRAAIEPIIGHCKNDGKTGPRNWLKGFTGDKINALALAIGFNLRKILKRIFYALQIVRLLILRPDLQRV
jgi:IS5 family transposase